MRGRCGCLASLVLLAACGPSTGTADVEGGDEPATSRSFAAVVAEHLGEPNSAGLPTELDSLGDGAVGAEVRYGSDGEDDGDLVTALAATDLEGAFTDCDDDRTSSLTGCEKTPDGLLFWEDAAPEEDPGVVYVSVQKGDATVVVFHSGPTIDADPRELDLKVSVDDLFTVANDPRIDVTTSQDAVDAGEAIDYWTGD